MSRACRRHLTSTAAAAVALALLPAAASAGSSWTTQHVNGLPVTLALPASWAVLTPPVQAKFFAQANTRDAYVTMVVGSYGGPADGFARAEVANARAVYRRQDPKAQVRSSSVALPGGNALKVVASLVRVSGGHSTPLSIVDYSFLRAGHVYEFTYVTATPQAAPNFRLFVTSARTIRFG